MSIPRPPVMATRLVQLRWGWLAGVLLAVLSAPTFLDIALPLWPLLALLALLAVFNAFAQRRAACADFATRELAAQLAIDLTGMTVLLYLTGGATNPLVSLLLLPVVVAALALPGRWAAGVTGLAIFAYSLLMLHSLPLAIADVERATRLHLGGMWLTFVVSAALVAWYLVRMTAAIRQRDALLAAAREQGLRDAQVVALGQLAAGTAHELGTPLATLQVLAGELARDARLPTDLREDLQLMQQQVGQCKAMIGQLTDRAGVTRAEQSMDVASWLAGVIARWRSLWPQAQCRLTLQTTGTPPLLTCPAAVGQALEQAIGNLLGNAARITPTQSIDLDLSWGDGQWRIAVTDRGPGFPDRVLESAGAQPLPAHEHGAGIGLWLTRSAVERTGGSLLLENLATGGGRASLILPLSGERL